MKTLRFILILVAAFAIQASAETQWVSYEDLSQKEKDVWGYKVERSVGQNGYAFFQLGIPPKAAELFQDAGLEVRDKQHQRLISSSLGFFKGADGWLWLRVERLQDFGEVEVTVTTGMLPGLRRYDFGGFTFHVPAEVKRP